MRFQFRAKSATTQAGTCVFGVGDDPDNTTNFGGVPQILDYRTSMERHLFQDVVLRWQPLDKDKWYYTTDTGDDRFCNPCLVAAGSEDVTSGTTNRYSFDIHYSITMAGACETALGLGHDDEAFVSLPPTPSGGPARFIATQKSITMRK